MKEKHIAMATVIGLAIFVVVMEIHLRKNKPSPPEPYQGAPNAFMDMIRAHKQKRGQL